MTPADVGTAEEIRDASVTLPKAIMWSVVINTVLGFIMAITLVFTLGDIDSLFASVTRQPFIQLFFNATQSYGGTNAMTAVVIILLAACCTSEVATASRQLWSFARDQGLPCSAWLSKVRNLLFPQTLVQTNTHPPRSPQTGTSPSMPS